VSSTFIGDLSRQQCQRVKLLEKIAADQSQPLFGNQPEILALNGAVERHAPLKHQTDVIPKRVSIALADQDGTSQLRCELLGQLKILKPLPIALDFAEVFVQPDYDALVWGRFGNALESGEGVLHSLSAGDNDVDENAEALRSQKFEKLVLQHVMPERNERCRASVNDVGSVTSANPLYENIKLFLIDASRTQYVQMLGAQIAELCERSVHRIGVEANDGPLFETEILS
jgi:hypothetical protein